ncbi:hypothetical protein C8R42DRAFT_728726 [Lentinula raphanica]|nr:hypothetical protein C8R42DRAFT_728726 [Lentinula raphanica]
MSKASGHRAERKAKAEDAPKASSNPTSSKHRSERREKSRQRPDADVVVTANLPSKRTEVPSLKPADQARANRRDATITAASDFKTPAVHPSKQPESGAPSRSPVVAVDSTRARSHSRRRRDDASTAPKTSSNSSEVPPSRRPDSGIPSLEPAVSISSLSRAPSRGRHQRDNTITASNTLSNTSAGPPSRGSKSEIPSLEPAVSISSASRSQSRGRHRRDTITAPDTLSNTPAIPPSTRPGSGVPPQGSAVGITSSRTKSRSRRPKDDTNTVSSAPSKSHSSLLSAARPSQRGQREDPPSGISASTTPLSATRDVQQTTASIPARKVSQSYQTKQESPAYRETTPDRSKQGSSNTRLPITPQAPHSGSYTSALAPREKYVVDLANKYLHADMAHVKILPVREFAKDVLNLDLDDKTDYKVSGKRERAFEQYLKTVDHAKNERDENLYPDLIHLLNRLPSKETNQVVFYVQDPKEVRGSHVGHKPDIGAVFKELAEGESRKRLSRKEGNTVLWGHLLTVVECKVAKGKLLEWEYEPGRNLEARGTAQSSTSSTGSGRISKRARAESTDEVLETTEKRASKASRSSSTSDVHSSTSINTELNSSAYSYPQELSNPILAKMKDRKEAPTVRRQAFGYGRDLRCFGVPRDFVTLFLIDSHLVRALFYDHSIVVESKACSFVHVIYVLELIPTVLVFKPQGNRGSTYFRKNDRPYIVSETLRIYPYTAQMKSIHLAFLYKGEKRTLKLGRVIFRSNGVIGRGTSVTEVECLCTNPNICPGGRCEWKNKNLVLKLSYPSATRASENEFKKRWTKLASHSGSPHAWVLNHLPTIYYSFDIHFRDDSPQQNLKRRFGTAYEMRVLRGVIMEKLEPLTSLKTAEECAQVFYDVLQCHHWVWEYPKILHRDISQGNIMVRVKNGRKYGVLNDWDLASLADDLQEGATSQYRTGTRPSMAHEQQARNWEGPHQYRHDVESLFYVMMLFTFLYSKPSKMVSNPVDEQFHYQNWHQFDDGTSKKCMIMALNSPWKPPVTPFFIHFSDWLDEIQVRFCWGFNEQGTVMQRKRDAERRGMQLRTQNVLSYKDEELGGHITYKTMVQIMHKFNEQGLRTYEDEMQEYIQSQEINNMILD